MLCSSSVVLSCTGRATSRLSKHSSVLPANFEQSVLIGAGLVFENLVQPKFPLRASMQRFFKKGWRNVFQTKTAGVDGYSI